MQVIGWTVGAIVVGALLYPLLMMARERKWCRFVGISPHEYKEVRHPALLLPLCAATASLCILLAASGVPDALKTVAHDFTQRLPR